MEPWARRNVKGIGESWRALYLVWRGALRVSLQDMHPAPSTGSNRVAQKPRCSPKGKREANQRTVLSSHLLPSICPGVLPSRSESSLRGGCLQTVLETLVSNMQSFQHLSSTGILEETRTLEGALSRAIKLLTGHMSW